MDKNDLVGLVRQAVSTGISQNWWVLILVVLASAIGAFTGNYLKKKGELLALEENSKQLLEEVKRTTQAVEEIKSRYSKEQIQMQINATVLSGNRQQWINSLRDQISEFLSAISMFEILNGQLVGGSEEEIKKYIERIYLLVAKIQLLLNPKENDHQNLIKLLGEISAALQRSTPRPEVLYDRKQVIISKTQEILKREWERVKAGK